MEIDKDIQWYTLRPDVSRFLCNLRQALVCDSGSISILLRMTLTRHVAGIFMQNLQQRRSLRGQIGKGRSHTNRTQLSTASVMNNVRSPGTGVQWASPVRHAGAQMFMQLTGVHTRKSV